MCSVDMLLLNELSVASGPLYRLYTLNNLDGRAFDLLDFTPFPIRHETGKHGDTAAEADE